MRVLRWLIVLAACGHAPPREPVPPSGDELTFYRDVTVVRQRIELHGRRVVHVPGDVTAKDVRVIEGHASVEKSEPGQLVIAGLSSVVLTYTTTSVHWDAAYTLTTTPARDRAELTGTLTIRNPAGVPLHGALRVIDADLASASRDTPPLELGSQTLAAVDSHVPLVEATSLRMHAVLVYDPIGTRLDLPSSAPSRDPNLGVRPLPSTHVVESFEVARDETTSAHLPAGPVRLLERRADGSLLLLGESRLFEASTRAAAVDTIAVGTADGVSAHRERRELTIDDDNKRVVEEFAIAIDNDRAQPARVLIREHMYRGLNWHLAYPAAPVAEKEGDQQIALHALVPAHAKAKQIYTVVYTWDR